MCVERITMKTEGKYILDEDGKPIEETDLMTWAKWFETSDRVVANDVIGDTTVSTVFLGMDHSYTEGPPVLYETMVFDGSFDGYQDRYETQEQALVGHGYITAMIAYQSDGEPKDILKSKPAIVLPSFNRPIRKISLEDE